MGPAEIAAQLREIYRSASTATLVEALRHLDHMLRTRPTREAVDTYRWVFDELERRFPEAEEAATRAFEDADEDGDEIDYTSILIAAIPPQSA